MAKTRSVQMSASGNPNNSTNHPNLGACAKASSRHSGHMEGVGRAERTRPLRGAVGSPTPSTAVTLTGTAPEAREAKAELVRCLSPRQVLAVQMLAQGRRGIEVAKALNLTEETVSRWRQRPEFQALMRDLLQETIETTRLGMVSLSAESIEHLRGLVRSFNDQTALKAISLVLGKVGPVLGVIGAEAAKPPARD